MKIIIAITFIIMNADALPQSEEMEIDLIDGRLISSNIIKNIDDMSQAMKDVGLDPLYIEKYNQSYDLPVPVVFNTAFFIEEWLSNGMSNIMVNSISYSILTSSLNFDIELPLVDMSVGNASATATLFGNTFKMESSGKVEVQRMHFVGQIRIHFSIIYGITIRSVNITYTLGGIESNLKLGVQDKDFSDSVNKFFGTTVPETFKAYSSEINYLLEKLLVDFIKQYMKTQYNLDVRVLTE